MSIIMNLKKNMKMTKKSEIQNLGIQQEKSGLSEKNQNNSVSNSELKIIEDSPFAIYKKNDEIFLVMGKYAIREVKSEDEAIELVKKRDWGLLFEVIALLIKELKNRI